MPHVQYHVPIVLPFGISLSGNAMSVNHTYIHALMHTHLFAEMSLPQGSDVPSSRHFLPKSEPPLPHVAQLPVFRFLHPVPHPAPWLHRVYEPGFLPGLIWKEEERCVRTAEKAAQRSGTVLTSLHPCIIRCRVAGISNFWTTKIIWEDSLKV